MTQDDSSINLTRNVSPDEFAGVESHIHGRSHMHRVMFWAKKICTVMGFQDIEGDVIAAARLHDLGRIHDGICQKHGARSATLIPKYDRFLRETFGMKNPEAVAHACSVHCLPKPLDRDHPHYLVAAALRDADALDRFRLGSHEGPKPEWIHFERTLYFAPAARQLAMETAANETPLEEIEALGEKLSNPAIGAESQCPNPIIIPGETPTQRRDRRLRQGKFGDDLQGIIAELKAYPVVTMAARLASTHASADPRIVSTMKSCLDFIRSFKPITYFPQSGYESFLKEKTTRCMWETGVTWQTKYAGSEQNARDAKAYNDRRLWGEKASPITYGVMLPPGPGGEETHKRLQQMYGEKWVNWKPECIKEMSFCINDSQENSFCLPGDLFEEVAIRHMLAAIARHESWAIPVTEVCPPLPSKTGQAFHFFEIQFHRAMTPKDILEPQ